MIVLECRSIQKFRFYTWKGGFSHGNSKKVYVVIQRWTPKKGFQCIFVFVLNINMNFDVLSYYLQL